MEEGSQIKKTVDPNCDVLEEYGMSSSFRRGSTSRAKDAEVPQSTIEMMNRWRKSERAEGRIAHLNMMAHYTDVRLALNRFLPYSKAL